jgi:two-component system, sensor histidine kinase and response regulator
MRSSIQQKILLLLLSLALPPLVLVGWLGLAGLQRARETARQEGIVALSEQAETALALRAQDKARFYDAALQSVQQQVEALAAYAQMRYAEPAPPLADPPVWVAPMPSAALREQYAPQVAYAQSMVPLLRTAVATNSLVSIGYIGLEMGGVIAFNDPAVVDVLATYERFDPRERPWYQQARAAGTTIWTEAYVDANTGTLATTCATPLYDAQGGLIGVLAFDLLLATIQDDLLMVDFAQSGYAYLVDDDGSVIVRPDALQADVRWDEPFQAENLRDSPSAELRAITEAMINREPGVRRLELDDQSSYVAYAPITTAGWSVALVIPAAEIIAPAEATGLRIAAAQDQLRNQLVALLLVMAAAIGLLGLLLSHSFSRRIQTVRSGVQAVAGGDLARRLSPAGQDEIGELADAFNGMAATLQEKVAELEQNARQLATLNSVSNELKGILDLKALFQRIPDVICERFGFDRAALYLVSGQTLRVVGVAFGPENAAQARYFMEVANTEPLRLDGHSVEADVVRTGKAVIVDDPWNHPHVVHPKQAASASNAYVQVPIFGREERVIGLLSADYKRTQRLIQAQDAGQLLMFASMVGLTIENARLYSDLERQVAARTEELRAALAQAQLADQRKSDFLASVSHELRTPLNAIIGFSTVLLDGLDGPLAPAQREDVQSINRNGRFLLHLINDLLDLAKIEAGHLNLEPRNVDLRPLTAEVIDTVQTLLRNRQITLHSALPNNVPLVCADADRVRQILLNLLANAVKFTDQGTITISGVTLDEIDAHGKIGRCVAISVADTGIGIASERHEAIFEEFVQVHERRPRLRGTGLGLSIVRKLVEAQHGRIWLESAPGQGSTFTFTLPVAVPTRDAALKSSTVTTAQPQ